MVVFLLFGRAGVISREGMRGSLRDGPKACQSNGQEGIGEGCFWLRAQRALNTMVSLQGIGQLAERFAEGAGPHRIFSSCLLP